MKALSLSVAILFFSIGPKNTNLVEDVEILFFSPSWRQDGEKISLANRKLGLWLGLRSHFKGIC